MRFLPWSSLRLSLSLHAGRRDDGLPAHGLVLDEGHRVGAAAAYRDCVQSLQLPLEFGARHHLVGEAVQRVEDLDRRSLGSGQRIPDDGLEARQAAGFLDRRDVRKSSSRSRVPTPSSLADLSVTEAT